MDSQLVQVVLVSVGGAVARRSKWRGGATTALLPGVAADNSMRGAAGSREADLTMLTVQLEGYGL